MGLQKCPLEAIGQCRGPLKRSGGGTGHCSIACNRTFPTQGGRAPSPPPQPRPAPSPPRLPLSRRLLRPRLRHIRKTGVLEILVIVQRLRFLFLPPAIALRHFSPEVSGIY